MLLGLIFPCLYLKIINNNPSVLNICIFKKYFFERFELDFLFLHSL